VISEIRLSQDCRDIFLPVVLLYKEMDNMHHLFFAQEQPPQQTIRYALDVVEVP
jgi:hypothetical protein